MVRQDAYNLIECVRAISPMRQTNSDTAVVSQIIDTRDYLSGMFVIQTGSLTDADATFTVLVEESDASDMSGSNAVADVDMLPTPNNVSSTAPETAASFTVADDDAVKKVGYVGTKAYVRLTVTPSANGAGNLDMSALWVGVKRLRGNVNGS